MKVTSPQIAWFMLFNTRSFVINTPSNITCTCQVFDMLQQTNTSVRQSIDSFSGSRCYRSHPSAYFLYLMCKKLIYISSGCRPLDSELRSSAVRFPRIRGAMTGLNGEDEWDPGPISPAVSFCCRRFKIIRESKTTEILAREYISNQWSILLPLNLRWAENRVRTHCCCERFVRKCLQSGKSDVLSLIRLINGTCPEKNERDEVSGHHPLTDFVYSTLRRCVSASQAKHIHKIHAS